MNVELQEAFWFLFTGRGLFMSITMISSGFAVGYSCRIAGRIGWSIAALLVCLTLFFNGSYWETLDLISRTGAGGVSIDLIFVLIMAAMIAFYFGCMIWGGSTRADEEGEIAEQAASMTEEQFIRIIDISAAHPVVGQAGWLVDRWKHMEEVERAKWVSRNLVQLRDLEARTDGQGIESLGVSLPGWLASFDHDSDSQAKPRTR